MTARPLENQVASAAAAAARAKLAAALLGHDLSTDPLANPFLPIHTSAVLQPVQHLLRESDRAEQDLVATAEPLAIGKDEMRDSEAVDTVFAEGGIEFRRRPSYSNAATWSAAVSTNPSLHNLDLTAGEEEQLADEWGLSEALSRAESVSSAAIPGEKDISNPPLERRLSIASDAALLRQRKDDDLTGSAANEDDLEILETRSEPALSRQTTITFADEVLGNLEHRLQAASTRAALVHETATERDDGYVSDGPRLKILERTQSQRRRERRPHSSAVLQSLPSLHNVAGDDAVEEWTSGVGGAGGRGGIASRDSLFRGAQATRRQSTATGSFHSDELQASRPTSSIDQYGVSTRPPTRLSLLAMPDTMSSPARDGPANPSRSPESARDLHARPKSAMSVYTSRFDPAVMAAQRAELVKDRPKFVDPDAGKPPRVVLMPAPLAGQPTLPLQPPRLEGPEPLPDDADSSVSEDDFDGDEEEVPPGLQEPKRPAGALYGRSLLDVMAERKALLKGQQRAYVPGSDGRRQMFDVVGTNAQQGYHAGDDGPPMPADAHDAEFEGTLAEDVPRRRTGAARPALVDRKAVQSIFGPDMLYQRELAVAKELEAIERQEREAHEQLEALKRDEAGQRKVRNKLRKGAAKKRKGLTTRAPEATVEPAGTEGAAPTEWIGPLDLAWSDDHDDPPSEQAQNLLLEASETRQSVAPSLSVPRHLANGVSTSTSDWFQTQDGRAEAERAAFVDEDDAPDAYEPRPLSSLTAYGARQARPLRRAFSFGSDDASTFARGQDEENGSPVRRLPLPGESSSLGHSTASVADTEDDRPLGHRFLLPDGTVAPLADVDDADSEDEEPLGKGFSRMSLPHITAGPLLQGPAEDEDEPAEAVGIRLVDSEDGSNDVLRHRFAHTSTLDESDGDEDEKPLGARFSTMIADADEVPLALHRLSLAPRMMSAAAIPTATLRPVDDDGKSIVTDSDDAPLGLRTGAVQTGPQGFYPNGMALHSSMMLPAPNIYPGAMSYPSLPMPPPPPFYSTLSAPFLPSSMPLSQFPAHAPHLGPLPPPPPPPPPPMQFAVAEMQMQAALHTSQAAATFGGAGASIDRWRKSVQP